MWAYLHLWTTHAGGTVVGSLPCETLGTFRMAACILYTCFCGCCWVLQTLKPVWADQPGHNELCWTSQCPESPRWLYLRLPLMTCSSATFLLRGSSGPWLVSCIPMGTASSTLAVQERSLDEQNFLYFFKVSVKSSSPSSFDMNGNWSAFSDVSMINPLVSGHFHNL